MTFQARTHKLAVSMFAVVMRGRLARYREAWRCEWREAKAAGWRGGEPIAPYVLPGTHERLVASSALRELETLAARHGLHGEVRKALHG